MRKQRWLGASAALVSMILVLAACTAASPSPSAGGSTAESTLPSTPESVAPSVAPVDFLVCQVTDTGGADDKGFNQSAWEGVQRAGTELGVQTKLLESTAATDYAPNLKACADQGADLIFSVGFLLGDDTLAAAQANPQISYAIVDYAYDAPPVNLKGLVFDTKSASMLQGYLAAGMSKSGTVATFGGIQIGPVVDFMNGYAAGVNYYNSKKGTNVKVLGWDPVTQTGSFTNDFTDLDKGRQQAEGFMQEGADVIFAVAGPVGQGAMAAVKDNPSLLDPAPVFIGVDVDQFISVPGFEDIMLNSELKNISNAVFDVTQLRVVVGAWSSALYVGTLKNNGVGIAPYHNFDSKVPQALKDEVTALQAALIDGSVSADAFSGQVFPSAAP